MKRLLKKRWHSLPVGIITAALLLCLVAGSAFAAYTAWEGTVDVGVDEAFTVDLINGRVVSIPPGDPGEKLALWDENILTLTVNDLMPGECVAASINVLNYSSVDLSATVEMVKTDGVTDFQEGTEADVLAGMTGGAVPTYSWMTLVRGTYGNPLTFNVPADGATTAPQGPVIAFQAGTEIEPGDYTFTITVKR